MKFIKPLQIQAYESLKDMILSGSLEHRKIYSETKVSQTMGISRTPLRDAIQRLSQEGYVDVIPSKGFRLHELNERDLLETYQIRCALEGFCVVQLARDHGRERTERTLETLEELLQEQKRVIDTSRSIEDFARYDQQFHKTIVYSLENTVISDTFDSYHYQMSRQTHISLRREGRLEETLEEHRRILENIKRGSVSGSYAAALAHLEKPKDIIHLD